MQKLPREADVMTYGMTDAIDLDSTENRAPNPARRASPLHLWPFPRDLCAPAEAALDWQAWSDQAGATTRAQCKEQDMSTPAFDFDALFAPEDYLYFYQLQIGPERTAQEVDLMWRLLDLAPGMALLDLACGHGRIAARLAERGCHVVGLDTSSAFLDLARGDAAGLVARGIVAPEYILGDMRRLPWREERFDCIINWFTSFGYFDDATNRTVLEEAERVLKPGGRLLIDLLNREAALAHLQPSGVIEREGAYMIDQYRYDVPTGRMMVERVVIRNGQVRRMPWFFRLFTFSELRDWLVRVGFSAVEGFTEQGAALNLESRRMVVMATK
jgi:ubiquinone/menaquinone biosynthesis C-methylase UbiE